MPLFSPFPIRGVTLPNRMGVSPMCQYSCVDGFATDWHFVHLGSRAVGGAGLVIVEATAVLPEARISPADLGLWSDAHAEPLARIAHFIREQGSVAGIQLAHAGRKASTKPPWEGDQTATPEEGGWTDVFAPSAIAFSERYLQPKALTREGISRVVTAFADTACRAVNAGFQLIEIHSAHGYLLHEFLSPLANKRTDEYGGTLENRARILRDVVSAVRSAIPDKMPVFVRVSATDWAEGGLTVEEVIEVARRLKPLGVDLIDCSSGGAVPHVRIPVAPGYQTGFAERIRREAEMPTAAVGMITSPAQADHILVTGQADMVLLAREALRDPYWPLRAAEALGHKAPWPIQYLRAAPAGSERRQAERPAS
jgi:2,4-dienoyl-CoA reductase-like NADH-dependent reductase (Old Yellow Enzyme family)